ncbi:hypothetical protein NQZ68_025824 [Dissostichus eleginoides]|nr:hypothetical protein NQZ68_025824 [Dissostichus eleginoides]
MESEQPDMQADCPSLVCGNAKGARAKGRLGAARGCIPSALPKHDLRLDCTTNSTPLLVRYLTRSSTPLAACYPVHSAIKIPHQRWEVST